MVASIKGYLLVVKQLVSKGADIAAMENVSLNYLPVESTVIDQLTFRMENACCTSKKC